MSDSMRFVFPFKVLPWSSLESDLGVQIKPGPQMKPVGFIPVYSDIQSLVDDFGDNTEFGTFSQKCENQAT